MKKFLISLAAVAVAAFSLAACGSSDSSSSSSTTAAETSTPAETSTAADTGGGTSGGSGETVKVTADPTGQLAWTEDKLDAKAGSATIELVNNSPTTHNLELEDSSGEDVGKADEVSQGTSEFSADLKPGTYTYYCSLPGHREAGMEGTLTVK